MECMDWINLAQDRDRWRALVNAAFGFHKMRGISRVAQYVLASSQEGLHNGVSKFGSGYGECLLYRGKLSVYVGGYFFKRGLTLSFRASGKTSVIVRFYKRKLTEGWAKRWSMVFVLSIHSYPLTDIIFSLQPFLRVTALLASDRHLNSDLGLSERILNVGHDCHTKLILA
jgi:hypothetical protein